MIRFMGSIHKNLFIEEKLAVAFCVLVVWINAYFYPQSISWFEALRSLVFFITLGQPYYSLFFVFIYLLILLKTHRTMTNLLANKSVFLKDRLNRFIRETVFLVRPIVFLVLVTMPTYRLLANISWQRQDASIDALFGFLDYQLTGTLPFVWLVQTFKTWNFSEIMYYSYFSLTFVMDGVLAWFVVSKRKILLRLFLSAFLFSNIIAYPMFYMFPCKAPSLAYVLPNQEKYNYPAHALKRVEQVTYATPTMINGVKVFPISCFPSLHAVWSFFVIYVLYLVKKWTLVFSIPWSFMMLAGGLYLAQHYLVDYLVAIPVAIICLVFSGKLIKSN